MYAVNEKQSEPNVFNKDKWCAGVPASIFSYLDSFVASDGKCDKEILRRIGMTKTMHEQCE